MEQEINLTKDTPRLLEEDFILPQLYFPVKSNSPEKKLVEAVLMDAIEIVQGRGMIHHTKKKKSIKAIQSLRQETVAWFLDDKDYHNSFSFVRVCEELGVEGDTILKQLNNSGLLN